MALAAAQVIDALAARLAPMTATAGRVYASRAWPLDEASLPAWRVVAADETAERVEMNGIHVHRLDVEASAYTRMAADLDDALHALASSGLALLFASRPPYDLACTGITRAVTQEGEATVGVITLRLLATFYVNPAQPETIVS